MWQKINIVGIEMEEMAIEIENCSACGEVMDVTTLPPYTNVRCPNCEVEAHVKCKVGAYEIYKRQGHGGMSLVFAAKDMTLGRKVAIKLLNEDYSKDEKRIAEFEKEAKITASISHPSVVRVFTVGQAFGRYYIAMELVDGKSLEQLMQREGALSEKMVTRLAIEVVEGLKAAHQEGLIHRDMKPGNVLLDPKGRAKIVDFGLALMTSGGTAVAEEIWATPYYVPPETLEMKEEDLRSDVYALGASLYHALSGNPPFTTETKSTTELLKIKTNIPMLEKVAPSVSPFLCEVIDKAMAFDAADRFQSYEEFLDALRQVELYLRTGNEPAELADPDVESEGEIKNPLNKNLVLGGIAVVAAVVVGGVVLNFMNKPKTVVEPSGAVVSNVDTAAADRESLRVMVAAELRSAQHLLDQKKYKEAYQRYLKLALSEGMESETVYWAGIRSAISAWLGGNAEDARTALRQIIRKQRKSDEDMSAVDKRLAAAMVKLLDLKEIKLTSGGRSIDELDDLDTMVLFASGLKEWDQGRWNNAESFFKEFRRSGNGSEPGGMEYFQRLSGDYLADYSLLAPFKEGVDPVTVKHAKELQLQILAVRGKLQTKGRASYNTVEWQRQLSAVIKRLQAKKIGEESRKKEAAALAISQWRMAKKNAQKALDRREFKRALTSIEDVEAINSEDKEWRTSVIYLCESAVKLYSMTYRALDGKSADFEIRRADSRLKYPKLAGAKSTGILVKGSRGNEVLLAWSEISPESMMALHKKIQDNLLSADDRKERPEAQIAYLWLSGMTAEAKNRASKLGVVDRGFAERWRKCMRALE